MSTTARLIGLVAALAMLAFSCFIFVRTGDWVALVFILGSVGYGVFFFSGYAKGGGN